jgi:tetratricopeptide (TPR) repeat protein
MRQGGLSLRFLFLTLVFPGLVFSQTATPEADALFNRQDWAGAARAFKTVTDQNPGDGRAWFRLASALRRLEDYPAAAAAFQRAADLKFQVPLAFAGVARAYAAAGDNTQALTWMTKAAQSGFAQAAFIDSDPHLSALKTNPQFAAVAETVRRNAAPCMYNPEYKQFDFWLGEWDVQVSGQTVAHSRIEKIDDGCTVQENWMPFTGREGKSWNFYNAATGKWEQLWLSGGNVLKLEGALDGAVMAYRGVTPQPNSGSVQQRLTFTPMEGGRVRQFWQQSADQGKTWTVAFDGIYVRQHPETPLSQPDRTELLEHLRHSREVLAKALQRVSPAQARFKPAPDRWSILECAEHLAQAEQLLFADAIDGLKLPVGGRTTVSNQQMMEAWGTAKQKAKSSGDYDPAGRWPDLAAILKVFDERRAKSIDFVSTTEADLRGRICCGNLDIWQQLLAMSAHTLRHVQQMEDVKGDPHYPKA